MHSSRPTGPVSRFPRGLRRGRGRAASFGVGGLLLGALLLSPAIARAQRLAEFTPDSHTAFLAAGTAGLWSAGHLTSNPNMTGAARDLTAGLLIDGALLYALKSGILSTQSDGSVEPLATGITASAFTAAPILTSRFGWKVGAPAYALAVAAGMGTRDQTGATSTDVLATAGLGLLVGNAVAHHSARLRMPENLYMGKRGLGFKMQF